MQLMQKETKRLIRLVNENLDYEKIRSNQIVLVKQEFSAKEALENVAEQMRAKAQAKDDLIIVQVDAADRIYADYDRFIQIMVNLTQNAIQFTKNGTITLSSFPDGEQQIIQVKDTGIGIEKKDITSIWERFYKVDVSRKNTKFGESGIGLAVVQSLVMNHKGTVDVESNPGEGTTFTITLPTKTALEKNS
jgi:signal transduction histidine kinase